MLSAFGIAILVVALVGWAVIGGSVALMLVAALAAGMLIAVFTLSRASAAAPELPLADPSDRLAERLRHQADHDALTGLYNRRRFEQRAQAARSPTRRQRPRPP